MSTVTIIGSGISAVAAVVAAKGHGAEVTLIRGRPGATALSSGAWDIAGDLNRYPGLPWKEYRSPAASLTELVRRLPQHPYSLMMQNEGCSDLASFLEGSIEAVSGRLNLRLRGSIQKNIFLLNPLGGIKPTAYATPNHWPGNLLEMAGTRLLIVGFKGLATFSAGEVAIFFRELLTVQKHSPSLQVFSTELSLKHLPPALSPIPLASRLDRDEMIDLLHEALLEEAKRVRATHIALPPVIGIDKTDHILSRLKETTGIIWFETIGIPPSLPGLRLQRAIDVFLAGFSIEGEAIGATFKNRKIETIRIRNAQGKEEELPVERLVLATGRYIGGGIVKERDFREPVLNLPVFFSSPSRAEALEGFLEDHPLFSAGVRVNRNMQPVGVRGELLYENLWAAGLVIGGYNPATQHCGMGVAIGTGTLAGRLASL